MSSSSSCSRSASPFLSRDTHLSSSRTRKIKCVQTSEGPECESCRNSATDCVYGDRERYHALRGVSAAQSSAMPSPWNINPQSGSRSSKTHDKNKLQSPTTSSVFEDSPRESTSTASDMSQLVDIVSPTSASIPTTHTIPATPCDNSPVPQKHMQDFLSNSSTSGFFSSDNPQYPREDLMLHLSEVFIVRLSAHLPFIDADTLRMSVNDGTLQPLLANGIAALACRYVNSCLTVVAALN